MNNQDKNENRFTFGIEGMTCASCVRIVERSLKKMDGIHFVSINLGTEKGYVITESNITFDDVKKRIDSTGYRARKDVPDTEKVEKDFRSAGTRMILSLALLVPVTLLMMLHMGGLHLPWFIPFEFIAEANSYIRPRKRNIQKRLHRSKPCSCKYGYPRGNRSCCFMDHCTAFNVGHGDKLIRFHRCDACVNTPHREIH
jgi:Cu+-exporting ATPase